MTWGGQMWQSLAMLFGRGAVRIASSDALIAALQKHAAKTGQSTLFGYLKARMGAKYVAIFEDPAFQPSLRAAQEAIFAASLADLTLFVAVEISEGARLNGCVKNDLIRCCREAALSGGLDVFAADAVAKRVAARLSDQDWGQPSAQVFTDSPEGLVNAAPVSDGFKRQDREMIVNSVRFHWIEVRRRVRLRLDRDALRTSLAGDKG